MKKRLLLCVTDSDYTGAPLYVKQLEGILKEGFDIKIVLAKNGSFLFGQELKFDKNFIFKFSDFIAIFRSVILLFKYKPDIIWLNSFKMSVVVRLSILLYRKPKVIYTIHGLSIDPNKRLRNKAVFFVEKLLCGLVDEFIFLTKYDRDKFQKKVSFNINSRVIYNTSRISAVKKVKVTTRCKTFVTIARNDSQKDYQTLFNSFALFAKENRNTKLICVGRGTNSRKIRQKITELGCSQNIKVLGEISDVKPILEKADCFVLSTNYEGMPLVILEAMSFGLPIIATNISGMKEFVLPEYGILVEHTNIESLKQAFDFHYNLSHADLTNRKMASLTTFNSKFSMELFLLNYRNLLNELKLL